MTGTRDLQGKRCTSVFNTLLYSGQFSSTTACFRQEVKIQNRIKRLCTLPLVHVERWLLSLPQHEGSQQLPPQGSSPSGEARGAGCCRGGCQTASGFQTVPRTHSRKAVTLPRCLQHGAGEKPCVTFNRQEEELNRTALPARW